LKSTTRSSDPSPPCPHSRWAQSSGNRAMALNVVKRV
jgi:hypothetical protein